MKRIASIASLVLMLTFFTSCDKQDDAPDKDSPVIYLVGGPEIDVSLNQPFVDPGATAQDAVDGNISGSITVSGDVNVDAVGTYELEYAVRDAAGNETVLGRSVDVVNDADYLKGFYNVVASTPASSNLASFTSSVTTSDTENNAFTMSVVYFTQGINDPAVGSVDALSITVPSQEVEGGTIVGSGIIENQNAFELETEYNEGTTITQSFERQ